MHTFMNYKDYSSLNIILWLIYPAGLMLTICFMFFTCSNKNKSDKDSGYSQFTDTIGIYSKKEFSIPAIPDSIRQPEQRAGYLVTHYWDKFNFADTAYIHLPEVTEQAFADYLDILPHAPKEVVYFSICDMLGKTIKMDATHKMYIYFLDLYRSYLYDPNSPMRNDEYYIPVTNYILKDTLSDEATRQRAGFDLSTMLKNRRGEIASNIVFTRTDGKTANLYSLNKDYTLLYFYNPDCHACKEMTAYMVSSPLMKQLITSDKLEILALYIDEDIDLWKKYIPQIPSSWVNAYDKELSVHNQILYDLKAIPCLYLLDRQKRVVLKDTDAVAVENYLDRSQMEGSGT